MCVCVCVPFIVARSAEMGQSDSGKFSATKVKKVGPVDAV